MDNRPTPPPRPRPLGWDDPPRIVMEQRGNGKWEVWVSHGMTKFANEWGSYAWTRKRAIKKGRRLMRAYQRRQVVRREVVEGG